MCTAVTYKAKDFYFGRTLDNDFSYGEEVKITPRNYPFRFRGTGLMENHYALIGIAYSAEDYPLYYDAVNEKGLCAAGLNFVGNAYYNSVKANCDNVAQFEFIPWILSQCASVREAETLLGRVNIVNSPFRSDLPPAQLHWLIADSGRSITVEAVREGLKIYDNPVGVLTNNPPFNEQLFRLNDYMSLSPEPPKNNFSDKLSLRAYSLGMGAVGLPGDLSSGSRFVRAAFVKMNSVSGKSEEESVGQFFHILGSVNQPRGCSAAGDGSFETTVYTSCCNANKGIYYYTTYENHQITAVDMNKENLESSSPICYPLVQGEQIKMQN